MYVALKFFFLCGLTHLTVHSENPMAAKIFWSLFPFRCQCPRKSLQLKHNFCIFFLSTTESVIQNFPTILYSFLYKAYTQLSLTFSAHAYFLLGHLGPWEWRLYVPSNCCEHQPSHTVSDTWTLDTFFVRVFQTKILCSTEKTYQANCNHTHSTSDNRKPGVCSLTHIPVARTELPRGTASLHKPIWHFPT